jgi:outer membrane protein OmpA-like peptidoglycan-associated protein
MRALIVALVCLATPVHAADNPACTDPAWAPDRLPGFERRGCDARAWDSFHVRLADGERELEGRRAWVEYDLVDKTKVLTAAQARDAFVAQAQARGAKLMSKPGGYIAVLNQGNSWLIYEQGGGNDKAASSYRLTTIELGPLTQEVETRAMTGALETGGHACADPPWLVRGLAMYRRTACESRAWDVVTVRTAAGSRDLEGKRATAVYEPVDGKLLMVPLAAQRNFSSAFAKLGAEVVSDPKASDVAVAHQGDDWLIWKQGSGNAQGLASYQLTTVQVAPLPQVVEAKLITGVIDTTTCADPPWLVKGYPKFDRTGCKNRDLDSIKIRTKDGEKILAGAVHEVSYGLKDKDDVPTMFAVQRNFVNALAKIGAEQVSDPKDASVAVMHQKIEGGGEVWYIWKQTGGNSESVSTYGLLTLQVGAPVPPKQCKLEIYGVNFDFDKATLRPDSEPVLQRLLALFTADAKLAGEIGGHTDNVGKPAYNLTLSGQRADAVKAWLVAHGVAAARLSTHGYGDTVPLVPNDTDEHRGKNRRVELKRENCR